MLRIDNDARVKQLRETHAAEAHDATWARRLR
jgi:hypothetical protein